MSPEERAQTESAIIKQYDDGVRCLELLYHRVREDLRLMSVAFGEVDRDLGNVCISDESLKAADELRLLVEDYRETHNQCTRLKEALSNLPIFIDVPHRYF